MTNNHIGRLACSRQFVCSLIPAALPSQLLCNVTSGSFLEADQLREINFPQQPHACNGVLQRIIDEECDIMRKYFRFHHSNCPQLKGEGGEGGDFWRNWSSLVKQWKQSWKSWLSNVNGGLLVFSYAIWVHKKEVYSWMNLICIPLFVDIQVKTRHKRIASFFLNTLSRLPMVVFD